MTATAIIRKLKIENFRGIKSLDWNPSSEMNIILGGGDVGKTTILEAIGLIFNPVNTNTLTEADFWNRDSGKGFAIEADISVSDDFGFSSGNKIYWPWEWNGSEAALPTADEDEVPDPQHPVFKVAVSASGEFDLTWEIIQPDQSREHFPAGLRRKFGLVKLSGDDKNDRDLRLVYGSALDRLLSDNSLRSKIGQTIAEIPLADSLNDDGKKALEELDKTLKSSHLPSGLDLGISGSQGISIGALIGLLAQQGETQLPLSSWGAGTRRMTALQIAAAKKADACITTIDELERGLEPYRLRKLVASLLESKTQSFVTTHSPIAVSCSEGAQLWYLDAAGNIGVLDREKTSSQQIRDPETFLSRVSVVVEGQTEVGFIRMILEKLFDGNLLDSGIRVCLGQGDSQLLDLLQSLENSGIQFAGFVDNDGEKVNSWKSLKENMGDRLFQWDEGCIESNVIRLLPDDYLEALLKDGEEDWDGYRLRTIATRLGVQDKSIESIQSALAEQQLELKDLIISAATGDNDGIEGKSAKKEWKKHAQSWFKKADGSGGRELLFHVEASKVWDDLEPTLRPFFNAILDLSGKPSVEKVNL
jgi:putative ATP-dependent endonuclease of OLD family